MQYRLAPTNCDHDDSLLHDDHNYHQIRDEWDHILVRALLNLQQALMVEYIMRHMLRDQRSGEPEPRTKIDALKADLPVSINYKGKNIEIIHEITVMIQRNTIGLHYKKFHDYP